MSIQKFAEMAASAFAYMFVCALLYFVSDWTYSLEWGGWWTLYFLGVGAILFMIGEDLMLPDDPKPDHDLKWKNYDEWALSLESDDDARNVSVSNIEKIWMAAREER